MDFQQGRGQDQEKINADQRVENLQVKSEEKFVLIDTDGGTDDAWAIFLLLPAHKNPGILFRVVGITCTYGNTHIDNVTANVMRILETAKVTDIPVFRGAEHPLHSPFTPREGSRHGLDGFGDANLPPVRAKIQCQVDGANGIVQMSELYKAKLSILSLGPLTNLALALQIQPEIKKWIKEIYIVGGNQQEVETSLSLGQFNIQVDIDAAKIVMSQLSSSCVPIFVIPWETFSQSGFEQSFRVDKLGKLATDEITLLNTIERNILNSISQTGTETATGNNWVCADLVAAAVCLEPMLVKIKEKKDWKVDDGTLRKSKGLFFLGESGSSKSAQCFLIKELDMKLYEKMLVWAVGGSFLYRDY